MSSSKWILGFAGSPRPEHGGDWSDTFIGGNHVFPDDIAFPVPPCPLCAGKRLLVLQAFAPHNAHSERELYLYACNSIRCSHDAQAWFAMRLCRIVSSDGHDGRGEQVDTSEEASDPARGHSEGGINWDTDSESNASSASDLDLDLAALSLQVEEAKDKTPSIATTPAGRKGTVRNSWNESNGVPPCERSTNHPHCNQNDSDIRRVCHLQSYYVEVMEEPAHGKASISEPEVDHLLRKYKEEESALSASGVAEAWGAEQEEDETVASKAFDKFQDRISRAPEQILRYGFNCEPIWPKHPPPNLEAKSVCICGSSLVFEVQVLGSCLHYLQPDKSVGVHRDEAGMNFAAVAIYTCEHDCTSSETLAHSPSFKIFRQAVAVQQDEW